LAIKAPGHSKQQRTENYIITPYPKPQGAPQANKGPGKSRGSFIFKPPSEAYICFFCRSWYLYLLAWKYNLVILKGTTIIRCFLFFLDSMTPQYEE